MLTITCPDATATQALGAALAPHLGAGDLLVLTGGLGAGKTTFTQGLASGLNVEGTVTSPTYIVARIHPSKGAGPDLVHVDAYRIDSLADLETLDLDTTLDEAITVVEWGASTIDALHHDYLDIVIDRESGGALNAATHSAGGTIDLSGLDDGARTITFTPHGSQWERRLTEIAPHLMPTL
ncbi:MAG: tRNA (adenosine(37)-N6)-threonylcarbamoyltransferase complex ATPase subunit type 1 TsaE [Actinomycetaceae bacterium]|nr:tRNA (adenosine(37)-N6)-threonylcarbamoyltransferase complex ATPase subunit type 1 TsaE [Actinomycetaceae bacterium]